MFDCNNKKEANLYRNNKVIKSVRMYGQFGSVVVHQKDFILKSICKFPKDCFDDHLRRWIPLRVRRDIEFVFPARV